MTALDWLTQQAETEEAARLVLRLIEALDHVDGPPTTRILASRMLDRISRARASLEDPL